MFVPFYHLTSPGEIEGVRVLLPVMRGGGGRWTIGRVAYWGVVVGLWLLIAMAGGKFSSVSWVQRQSVIAVTPNSAQTMGSGIKLSGFVSLGGVAAAPTGAVPLGDFWLVI